MKKRFRSLKAILLSIVMVVLMILSGIIPVSAMTQSDFNNRVAAQQSAYPNGSVCKSTQFGQSCFGWAYLMGYNIFGSSPYNWATTYTLSSVKAGDIIQYGNTSGSGHTVFVVSVSGNNITFADCNGNGNRNSAGQYVAGLCMVKWNNSTTISANALFGYGFSYIKSAPEAITSGYNPEGYLESAIASAPDKLTIKGWAYDKDNINQSIYVDVYAFQKRIARITANKYREDVGKKYGVGNYHGFEETITMPQIGTYNIAVYAINIEGGKDTEIYYHSVKIPNFPQGQVESVIASAPDCITIKGWAFDKDDINASVYIDIYAFRNRVARITADKLREDIGSKYSVGNYHGFEETIHMPQNGTYNIAVYAMNIGEGKETEIYYQSITVPNYPTGEVESVISTSPNKLTIKGWAFDKDDINSSVYVDIYAFRNRVARITADKLREDIGNEYSVGDYHGFEETIEMPQSGTYNIAVYAMNIGDGKETNIYYDSVYVLGEEKYTIGDTNLDGKITISDVTAIQRHIAELEPFTEAQLTLADTNGDGKVTIGDATHLQKYLARYNVKLGKQS